jgi:DNA mismatch repair ATPase MutS
VISGVNCNAEGVALFSRILERLEREPFEAPRLRQLVAELKRGAQPASTSVRQFARIVNWIDAHDSLIARILDWPLLYTIQTGLAAEAWRRKRGPHMRTWIDIAAEAEALLSLATYSFEHPADPFPEFAGEGDSAAAFAAEELGHPLIEASKCVLTPLALGTRLRSVDSLQEGRSTFYTELLRIRQVFDMTAGATRVLFLFDELLDGTNSRDRKVGAEHLVRVLLERGAIGIVTTHDLALTEMAASAGGMMQNAHFQDYVEDDKMRFDYKLRDGVVTKSNALELMRLAGLDV